MIFLQVVVAGSYKRTVTISSIKGTRYYLQHLGLYSLRGSRKREYPASLFFQHPWWGEFKPLNDYFASLSKIMSECEPVIDFLVIHPMRSAWIFFDGFNRERVQDIDLQITISRFLQILYS